MYTIYDNSIYEKLILFMKIKNTEHATNCLWVDM